MLDGWVKYTSVKRSDSKYMYRYTSEAYRLYLLALVGKANLSDMNLLKENSLTEMRNVEKWLLAGAYQLAGLGNVADALTKNLSTEVKPYNEFAGNYGSDLRDQAIILNILVQLKRYTAADELAKLIADQLTNGRWHSTQTTGFSILALGKYLNSLKSTNQSQPKMAGSVKMPDGKSFKFDTDDFLLQYAVEGGFGKNVEITMDNSSTLNQLFVTMNWDGVPLIDGREAAQKNINMDVKYYNEDGQVISPTNITQGTVFWAHYSVNSQKRIIIEEIALTQILPSGWEVVNTRLNNEELPNWMRNFKLNSEEYLDIRDDRIMWFFDLNRYRKVDFVVKLSAVTIGEFTLSGTTCEAMYKDDYFSVKAPQKVSVTNR